MIFVESSGRIAFMNPAGLRLLGASVAAEVLGKRVSEIIVHDQQNALLNCFNALLRGERPPAQELRMRCLDEKLVDVELTLALLQTSGSRGMLGIALILQSANTWKKSCVIRKKWKLSDNLPAVSSRFQ